MEMDKGKFYIGKIKDFAATRGYFVGHFMEEKGFLLLQSSKVEVAWKKFSKYTPLKQEKHTHKKSIEINIVISGWIKVEINGKKYKIKKGEFYVIHPFNVTKDLEVGKNTEMIIVKAPSVPEDKHKI